MEKESRHLSNKELRLETFQNRDDLSLGGNNERTFSNCSGHLCFMAIRFISTPIICTIEILNFWQAYIQFLSNFKNPDSSIILAIILLSCRTSSAINQ